MSFKTFLAEHASPTYALKYFEYEKNKHDDNISRIKSALVDKWNTEISKFSTDDLLGDQDAKLSYEMKVDKNDAKIGRYDIRHMVSPSVLIGGGFDSADRYQCKKNIMASNFKLISKCANKLNRDLRGSPFYASQDDDALGDIRLKFRTGQFKKTILLIGIEPGRKFERIYLRDFIR